MTMGKPDFTDTTSNPILEAKVDTLSQKIDTLSGDIGKLLIIEQKRESKKLKLFKTIAGWAAIIVALVAITTLVFEVLSYFRG